MNNSHLKDDLKDVNAGLADFQDLLRKLFQIDAAELDFGIYRILNTKRTEVNLFIDHDLPEAVREGLAHLQEEQEAGAGEDLAALREKLVKELGKAALVNDEVAETFRETPAARPYIEARARAGRAMVSEQAERRIYDDLTRFFARYYESGDFVTKRRFTSRRSKYFVPYDGEEVLLHWANRDQYYIKSSEHFTNYFFGGGYHVAFLLHRADTPQDNVKASDTRYFVLHPFRVRPEHRTTGVPAALNARDAVMYDKWASALEIDFAYRPLTEKEHAEILERYNAGQTKSNRRKTLNRAAVCTVLEALILEQLPDGDVVKANLAQTLHKSSQTLLGQHLNRYTARNTSDYFVHKDLGGFLRGQLDFYIKNEVLHLDDLLGDASGRTLRQGAVRASVVRNIGERIIAFLAQVEDFQKRLFEKKKFVTETNYCATLDRVPEDLYPAILENEAQLDAWRELYRMDEWDEDLLWQGAFDAAFLENHPCLMVDTAHFDRAFTDALLASFEDVDEAVDGLLINGDNFQALNLLQESYREKVKCIYIDPPYNTGNDGFIYKDKYRHSSWLSMMADRLQLARELMPDDGGFFSTIDDNEVEYFFALLDIIFGESNLVTSISWQKKVSPSNDSKWFSSDHDHIIVYAKDKEIWRPYRLPRSEKQKSYYTNPDNDPRGLWNSTAYTCNKSRAERPNLYYPITNPNTGEEIYPKETAVWAYGPETHLEHRENDLLYWGQDGKSKSPRFKNFLSNASKIVPRTVWLYSKVGHTQEATSELLDLFPEGVFTGPKPARLIEHIARIGSEGEETVLDYFAGSGTTGHAVMNLNREDDGRRKYILVEMGDHFDTVLRPRLMKVAFSAHWKDGVPQDRDGQSHLIKYQRLESYEDALNNLRIREPAAAQRELLYHTFDDYRLHYMLDFETAGSPSLLAQDAFEDPFAYTLQIRRGHASPAPAVVDLEETFNYLIGLRVHRRRIHEHQERRYVVLHGAVETPTGIDKTIVIWRPTDGLDHEAEAAWAAEAILTDPLDRLYFNGSSHLPGAEPIEIAFRQRMDAGN